MKKLLLIVLVCVFALTALSCSQPAGPAAAEEQPQTTLPLLSSYPQDVLPLYQPYKLLSTGFSTYANDMSVVGREAYTVIYESAATQQELYKYYLSLLTENSATPAPSVSSGEDDSAAMDFITGKTGSSGVDISFLDNGNTITVYLSLGSKDNGGANPYFSAYPSGLVDEFGVRSKEETTYQEQYYGNKTIHYITVYSTGAGQQEFLQHYQKYASKQGFKQTTSQNGASTSWQDQGFSCNISYAGGQSAYVTIDVFRAG